MAASASTGLVLRVALATTCVIALAKFAAAAWTGSSAMQAAAIHALVDLSSQALMLIGLRRSARQAYGASRANPAGDIHFWSYVAAVLLFSMGAGVAIYEGAHRLLAPRPIADPIIAYWALGFATLLQGFAAWQALRAVPLHRDGMGLFEVLQGARDAPLLTLVAETLAGIVGLLLAVLGVGAAHLGGLAAADGAASMAIGLLLAALAAFMSLNVRALLSRMTEPAGKREAAQVAAIAAAEPVTVSSTTAMPPPPSEEEKPARATLALAAHDAHHGGQAHGSPHGKKKGKGRHRPR